MEAQRLVRFAALFRHEAQLGQNQSAAGFEGHRGLALQRVPHVRLGRVEPALAAGAEPQPDLRVEIPDLKLCSAARRSARWWNSHARS